MSVVVILPPPELIYGGIISRIEGKTSSKFLKGNLNIQFAETDKSCSPAGLDIRFLPAGSSFAAGEKEGGTQPPSSK